MSDRWYKDPEFELTEEHRKLAAHVNVMWYPDVEWGAVEFGDPKRPFGNSDMPRDVAEILGWDVGPDGELHDSQITRARQLHREMGYVAVALLAAWAEPLRIGTAE